jgi:hypothetical protein
MRSIRSLCSLICATCGLLSASHASAQTGSTAGWPDAPQPVVPAQEYPLSGSFIGDEAQNQQQSSAQNGTQQGPGAQNPNGRPEQTKRILGVIPNFRSVSTDEILPPQSPKEKFMTATKYSFDYSSIFTPAVLAGYSMGTDATPEFGQGAAGYARYFWRAVVDQTIANYMVTFVFPVITRQDNRYYTLGHGGFFKRTAYALSRVVITRNDAGHDTLNTSEVFGSAAAAGLTNLYYPASSRTVGSTSAQWGTSIGGDAASFLLREFWPDINRRIFHEDNYNGH